MTSKLASKLTTLPDNAQLSPPAPRLRISVVIAAYNAECFIGPTLTSILAQGISSLEIIVVDDGSTDNTASVVESFTDPRIRLIKARNFGGPARPRNIGLNASCGEIIFIFDADDIMLPGKLESSATMLERCNAAAFLFSNFQSIDESGMLLKESYLEEYESLFGLPHSELNEEARLIDGKHLLLGLAKANFIGTSSIAIKRYALESVGGFDERVTNGDDFLYWTQLALKHNAIYLDRVLHQYRVHDRSISRTAPAPRLSNLLLLHQICADNKFLPKYFRNLSAKNCKMLASELVKLHLKSGDTRSARSASRDLLRMDCLNLRSYTIAALSWIPASFRVFLISGYRGLKSLIRHYRKKTQPTDPSRN